MTDVIKEIEDLSEQIVNKRIELTNMYEDLIGIKREADRRENLMTRMDFLTNAEAALENAKDALEAFEAERFTE